MNIDNLFLYVFIKSKCGVIELTVLHDTKKLPLLEVLREDKKVVLNKCIP